MKFQEDNDGVIERKIFAAMVTDDVVLAEINSHWPKKYDNWEEGLFGAKSINVAAKLCITYYQEFGKAPKQNIETSFHCWAKECPNENLVKSIEEILSAVSNEYERDEPLNSQHVIKAANRHFTKIKLDKTLETAQGYRNLGKINKAIDVLTEMNRVESSSDKGEFIFNNDEVWKEALDQEDVNLMVEYPNPARLFFGNSLQKGAFITFLGPSKRGKTWWLIDMAFRACSQRKKVAFFEIGDMTAKEIDARFAVRHAQHPHQSSDLEGKWPCTVQMPKKLAGNEVDFENLVFEEPLDSNKMVKVIQNFRKKIIKSNNPYFWRKFYPAETINVTDIEAELGRLERQENFVPDVVILDYADNLREPDKSQGMSEIKKVTTNWKLLRKLSQTKEVLLITATQANRASFVANVIRKDQIGEDYKKLAQITGAIAINQTAEEEEFGIFRLGWLDVRGMKKRAMLRCASCLALGNPVVLSNFVEKKDKKKESEFTV